MSQYKVGTANFTNNSSTITGVGTLWSGNVGSGDFIIGPDKLVYTVSSVSSDTQLMITSPYGGSTIVSQPYVIHTDFLNGKLVFSSDDVESASLLNRWVQTTITAEQLQALADALGTAAALDTGTAPGELPTNAELDIPNKVVQKDSVTGAAQLPSGTLAQRPSVPVSGMFRFNAETVQFEGYSAGAWSGVGGASGGAGNPIMYEHDAVATEDYTLVAGKNAISGGPFEIANGVDIIIESGASWTIV